MKKQIITLLLLSAFIAHADAPGYRTQTATILATNWVNRYQAFPKCNSPDCTKVHQPTEVWIGYLSSNTIVQVEKDGKVTQSIVDRTILKDKHGNRIEVRKEVQP